MTESVSLNARINASFIRKIVDTATSGSTGASASPLGSSSDQAEFRSTARSFGRVIDGVSIAATYFNAAEDFLNSSLTSLERLKFLAEKASKGNISNLERRKLNGEFQEIAGKLADSIENAKLKNREYLKTSELEDLLSSVGITGENSKNLSAIFSSFKTESSNELLIDLSYDGDNSTRVPQQILELGGKRIDPLSLDDESASILTSLRAYDTLDDVNGVISQVEENIQAISAGKGLLEDVIEISRQGGLSFLQAEGASDEEAASIIRGFLRNNLSREQLKEVHLLLPLQEAMLNYDETLFS